MSDNRRPLRLSLVVPLYNVERYLPDFLDSVEAQHRDDFELECIFVDDGSPQAEASLVESWLHRTGTRGRLIRQRNSGVSAARNTGIKAATGDWIGLPDPDDVLSPNYLQAIADYIRSPQGERVDIVAAKLVYFIEETGEVKATHPLTYKFQGRAQNLSLRRNPYVLHLHTSSAFIRRSLLTKAKLKYDERLRISEDAILVTEILAQKEYPLLGVVPEAIYYYRKRATGDSALDSSGANPQYLVDRLRLGYVPLLKRLKDAGRLHEWVGHLVLYELGWIFRGEERLHPISGPMTDEQKRAVLEACSDLLAMLDETWIFMARRPAVSPQTRSVWAALRAARLDTDLRGPFSNVRVTALDPAQRVVRLEYLYVGDLPEETVRIGGKRAVVLAAKTQGLDYFGQDTLKKRLLWVDATSWLRVELDGETRPLEYDSPAPTFSLTRAEYWKRFGAEFAPASEDDALVSTDGDETPSEHLSPSLPPVATRALSARDSRLLHRDDVRDLATLSSDRLTGAWLFMDRVEQAGDNAEHLYRYVRERRPDINAWFVLERSSCDWTRLRDEGFRLVSYLSPLHQALLLQADHVISSHIDVDISNPIPRGHYERGQVPWRLTFLQHGVIQSDLSRWLNPKRITNLVTTTRREFDSIVADGSPYTYTRKEVILSGMPRHDALLEKATDAGDARERNLIVIAPTWRKGLFTTRPGDAARVLDDEFEKSAYYRAWAAFLASDELRAIASRPDTQFVFLPHPAMQDHIDRMPLPAWISVTRYSDGDIQQLLARTKMLVTDYSSIAFDAAFIGTPTTYFQFDHATLQAGGHIGSRGYYTYADDGFGPVSETPEDAVSNVSMMLAAYDERGAWPEPYATRISRTFEHRDGGARKRVLDAILRSGTTHDSKTPY